MKKLILSSSIILAILFVSISSCKKSDNAAPTINAVKGEGQWAFNGANFTADSSFSIASNYSIRIYKDFSSPTENKLINIVLTGLSIGNYTISATGPNTLVYTYGTTVQTVAQSGLVTITSNTGSRIAGTFNVQLNGMSQTLQGSFTDVGIR